VPETTTEHPGIQRVRDAASRKGVELDVRVFDESTHTAADAAATLDAELGQIVKSLVFECGGRWVVVLVPGDRRADSPKIARAVGAARAKIASPEQVEKATGFVAGAVAPFPLPAVDRVLVDRNLLSHKRVWIGAGSPRHMAVIAPGDLVRLAKAQAVDVVEAAT
jgi:Cys-tRNA(Pro) deacylase